MTWSDLTVNWAVWFKRIQTRFPHLDDSAMPFLKLDRDRFEAYVAATHSLTLREAREEFEDFLFIEGLAQEMADQRVGT